MQRRNRPGFIILFGSRNVVSNDSSQEPVQTVCPQCGQMASIIARSYRTWFTLFFIPVFPISGKHAFSQCTGCGAQFSASVNEIRRGVAHDEQRQNQQAIALYNSLRTSPANSITLNNLMLMYAGMNEFDQAISAAREFPGALNASEQCMATLGRVFLAAGHREESIKWFDAAIARNAMLGEAHYYKAIAFMTATPANYDAATTSARAARTAGFPNAEVLLQDIQEKSRQG